MKLEEKNEDNVKQLFYDLYNNTKNENADSKEFERLFKEYRDIAELHYDVLIRYLEYFDYETVLNYEHVLLERLSNLVQDFVVKEIFN
jgi:hypothetical protein